MTGSFTTASDSAHARVRSQIAERLSKLDSDGVKIEWELEDRSVPGVTNDPELVRRASASAESVLGEGAVTPISSIIPAFSEDFGFFQEVVPGVMFFLGVSNPETAHKISRVADGIVVGSAIVNIIEEYGGNGTALILQVQKFVSSLKAKM